jgi:selenide,water dikinase
MSPLALAQVLCSLPKIENQNLLVGLDTSDDAAVYKLNDSQAVILTLDFFTPVADDPYTFGQIAAANALSDIYAMGGSPLAALNIACFPECLAPQILREIIRGGAEKVQEAGAIVVGGHTVEDKEPKYGLSVLGLIHPEKVITNSGAKAGDYLVLTKPLGSGIINTAFKGGMVSEDAYRKSVQVMSYLNKDAGQAMLKVGVSGCTDITGFGFLGHASEMAAASCVTLEIWSDKLPLMEESLELAKMGMIPAGAYRNKEFLQGKVKWSQGIPPEIQDILYDPQTSGGLLIALPECKVNRLLEELAQINLTPYALVGRVIEQKSYLVEVK